MDILCLYYMKSFINKFGFQKFRAYNIIYFYSFNAFLKKILINNKSTIIILIF